MSDSDSKEQQKGLTRRSFLKRSGALIGGAFVAQDVLRALYEPIAELGEPVESLKTIDFLEQINFEIPQDKLYGFTFPSTKEVAQKYKEMLNQTVGDPPIRKLIIVEEKEPGTISGRLAQLLGINSKSEDPKISRPQPGEDGPIFIYWPAQREEDQTSLRAISLYHEGLHLFYQSPPKLDSDEAIFNQENMPNIGEILFERVLFENGFIGEVTDFAEIISAYDRAVAEKNPEIWEKRFKNLYALSEDCCVQTRQPNDVSK